MKTTQFERYDRTDNPLTNQRALLNAKLAYLKPTGQVMIDQASIDASHGFHPLMTTRFVDNDYRNSQINQALYNQKDNSRFFTKTYTQPSAPYRFQLPMLDEQYIQRYLTGKDQMSGQTMQQYATEGAIDSNMRQQLQQQTNSELRLT